MSPKRIDRKKEFIRLLAEFLSGPKTAVKSIELEMGKEHAREWAALRNATPVFGYVSVDETVEILTDFLG